jgi:hypothetical protein
MLTSATSLYTTNIVSDNLTRFHHSVLWPIWLGFCQRQGLQHDRPVPFDVDLERCKQMTLLTMEHFARVEECVAPKDGEICLSEYLEHLGTSLVHLLHEPSHLVHKSRLISAEWPQILPFLSKIGCSLETRNRDGRTPFLVAASDLRFSNILELSKQGVDISVRDTEGHCAFDLVLSQDWKTCSRRSSDLHMTIMALIAAGCNPRESSKWAIARELCPASIWNSCESILRNIGWIAQDIDELTGKDQSSSDTTRDAMSIEKSPEDSPSKILSQPIREKHEMNSEPNSSTKTESASRATASRPKLNQGSSLPSSKRLKTRHPRENQASYSPVIETSSSTEARMSSDDLGQPVDNLTTPFKNLDIGSNKPVMDKQKYMAMIERKVIGWRQENLASVEDKMATDEQRTPTPVEDEMVVEDQKTPTTIEDEMIVDEQRTPTPTPIPTPIEDKMVVDEQKPRASVGSRSDYKFDPSLYVDFIDTNPNYRWFCCYCKQHNSGVLNPLCIGMSLRTELCEHRWCEGCSVVSR